MMKKDGWKRLFTHTDVWFFLVIILATVWCAQSLQPTELMYVDDALDVLSVISIICVLLSFVDAIIGADDYYRLVMREGGHIVFSQQIYLYKRKYGTYKMITINYTNREGYFSVNKNKLLISNYKCLTYEKAKFFLFTLVEKPACWYLLCGTCSDEQKLGHRIGETAFIKSDGSFNKKVVSILTGKEFAVYHADECFFDNVSVADKTGKKALFANQYIVIKDGEQYKVLGLYFSDKKVLPYVAEEENVSFSILAAPNTHRI